MQQDCVAYWMFRHTLGKGFIELRALPDVLKEEVAVRTEISLRVLLYPVFESGVDCPVGRVYCGAPNAIAVLSQERTHAITFLHGVAFLEERKAE